MFDILFRNAKVIDGTGNPWFYGDVGVEGGTVAAVLPPGSTARARPAAGAWAATALDVTLLRRPFGLFLLAAAVLTLRQK